MEFRIIEEVDLVVVMLSSLSIYPFAALLERVKEGLPRF